MWSSDTCFGIVLGLLGRVAVAVAVRMSPCPMLQVPSRFAIPRPRNAGGSNLFSCQRRGLLTVPAAGDA